MVERAPGISHNGQKSRGKKIVQKVGAFFGPEKTPVKTPRLPRIPPRSHQQKTIPSHSLFPKPSQKLKNLHKFPAHRPHDFFLQKRVYNVNRMWLKVFSNGVKKTLKIKLPPTRNRMIIPNIPTRS
jgi:hypothetical protein